MWAAIGAVFGAIGLSLALAFVASWIGGDAEEAAYLVGMLVGLPAFLMLLPVLILAVIVDYAGRRAYPGKPIIASWDVKLDGAIHVVSLPGVSAASTDYLWVDGARMPLEWTPTGATTASAALDGGPVQGALSRGYAARESAAIVAVSADSGTTAGGPVTRYTLQVKRGTVEAIPVTDGERRS